jgi:hypothetical protein
VLQSEVSNHINHDDSTMQNSVSELIHTSLLKSIEIDCSFSFVLSDAGRAEEDEVEFHDQPH